MIENARQSTMTALAFGAVLMVAGVYFTGSWPWGYLVMYLIGVSATLLQAREEERERVGRVGREAANLRWELERRGVEGPFDWEND